MNSMQDEKIALLVSPTHRAQEAAQVIRNDHDWVDMAEADRAIVLGGDGFMLQVLHQMIDKGRIIPVYGMNLGTVGFLMNLWDGSKNLFDCLNKAKPFDVVPLRTEVTTMSGERRVFSAINEVSLLRETRQTAKLEVIVNGMTKIPELACDGVLVATPAGSTAYNLSANGPILPLGSSMLALTPISPFRPRRWKGAILADTAKIGFRVREGQKRPVLAVADQKELRDVSEIQVEIDPSKRLTLLFDPNHSLDERIAMEQFLV
ncbi:NAD kinase [Sphingorhabdus sp. Alg239-R122]|uniref:NAD kinase n=1 Tax=Sphingorhabdus sp. Alg239-R122 TaxID=2305989 RepID=UPI001F071B43|nr:NAD kinase [Sphingorhabdus sp. Alg239-R122]